MTTSLTISSSAVRQEGEVSIFSEGKVDVATLQLVGAELIVDFAAPRGLERFAAVMRHYQPIEGKPGWLRFRRPATRDPRPGLAADLGSMLGVASFERRQKPKAKKR